MAYRVAGAVRWKLCSTVRGVIVSLLCLVYILLSYHNFTPFNRQVDESHIERKYEQIPECNCVRKNYYYQEDSAQRTRLLSSCSDPGTFFQPLQKVVSYSLYLPKCISPKKCQFDRKSFYLEGILENLRTMRLHYPTYTMRLYTDVRTDPKFCSVICNNSDLFWCDIRSSPMYFSRNLPQVFFMMWRFLPLGDSTVDHFLSRDLDSILTEREAAVVTDWLRFPEKKAIHLMRDIKFYHNYPILGGMWGASNSFFGCSTNQSAVSLLASILNAGMDTKRHQWGFDQEVLKSEIFYPLKDKIVAYDSSHCEDWRNYTLVRPYPRKRKNNSTDFVGNSNLGRRVYRLEKCPIECRPEYGKDWEWC